eukprot:1156416-Pelagomonas_calceolata.AAC.1
MKGAKREEGKGQGQGGYDGGKGDESKAKQLVIPGKFEGVRDRGKGGEVGTEEWHASKRRLEHAK